MALVMAAALAAPLPETQVVGGAHANAHEFPFMAHLRTRNVADWRQAYVCGGVLIAPRWVATAQHCVFGMTAGQLEVVLGDHLLHEVESTEVVRHVQDIRRHPGFSMTTGGHDIALLYLASDVPLTPGVVEVAARNWPPTAGGASQLSGWGVVSPQSSRDLLSSVLKKADASILPDTDTRCPDFVRSLGLSYNGQVCAVPVPNGGSACFGDSGGPLMIHNNGVWNVVGLTSFGPLDCAGTEVFTRINRYDTWIQAWMLVKQHGAAGVSMSCRPMNNLTGCHLGPPYSSVAAFNFTWSSWDTRLRTIYPTYGNSFPYTIGSSTIYFGLPTNGSFAPNAPCPSGTPMTMQLSLDGLAIGSAMASCP
jgi:secreted trypsin-like serine protease